MPRRLGGAWPCLPVCAYVQPWPTQRRPRRKHPCPSFVHWPMPFQPLPDERLLCPPSLRTVLQPLWPPPLRPSTPRQLQSLWNGGLILLFRISSWNRRPTVALRPATPQFLRQPLPENLRRHPYRRVVLGPSTKQLWGLPGQCCPQQIAQHPCRHLFCARETGLRDQEVLGPVGLTPVLESVREWGPAGAEQTAAGCACRQQCSIHEIVASTRRRTSWQTRAGTPAP